MVATAIATPARAMADTAATRRTAAGAATAVAVEPERKRPGRAPRPVMADQPDKPDLPAPEPSLVPLSQTVWAGRGSSGSVPSTTAPSGAGLAAGTATALLAPEDAGLHEPVEELLAREWQLPSFEILDVGAVGAVGQLLDHGRNIRIIEEKLPSFQIPAKVVATNTGPVVTQYEVKPDVARQALAHRGARRRPGHGSRGALDPDRGAHPGPRRRRHRDPQPLKRDRGLPQAARGRAA